MLVAMLRKLCWSMAFQTQNRGRCGRRGSNAKLRIGGRKNGDVGVRDTWCCQGKKDLKGRMGV